jgi:hypothetical protein
VASEGRVHSNRECLLVEAVVVVDVVEEVGAEAGEVAVVVE